jgi:hypothetical protein
VSPNTHSVTICDKMIARASTSLLGRSLLLSTRLSSLSLGNTSDLLYSALDFLSLLSAGLASNEEPVLYNTH